MKNRTLIIVVTVVSFVLAAVIGIILLAKAPDAPEHSKPAVSVSDTYEQTEAESGSESSVHAPATSTAAPETTTVTTPAATITTAESTATPTVQSVTGNTSNPRDPVRLPPEPSGKPCTFYNDAAFIGDSVSVMLTMYANSTGVLGKPLFLTKECYGMAHAGKNSMLFDYDGKQVPPEDALAAAGVKKVFIMLGMNDIGYDHNYIMNNWRTVVGRIREKCPGIKIYIQSCTPIWTGGERDVINNQNMDAFNLKLKALASELGCTFVDVAPYFKDSTGGLATKYCSDHYVHLTTEGVAAWAKFLIAYGEAAS